jgi:NADH dehydrogenase FAD-containing subunit
VTSVDFEAKLLTVDRQQGRSMQIKYDKLVLATGSTVRR